MHIIETTASIPSKFCTMIKTSKCSSWMVQTREQQIQDGGRPPSWKIKTSRYLCNRWTDLDEIWHGGASRTSAPRQPIKIVQILKTQYGGRSPFWKSKTNRYISVTVLPITASFGMMTHIVPVTLATVKNSKYWKSRWRRPLFKN